MYNFKFIDESEINKETKFTVRLPKENSENKSKIGKEFEKKDSHEINMIEEMKNIRYKTKTELSDIYI